MFVVTATRMRAGARYGRYDSERRRVAADPGTADSCLRRRLAPGARRRDQPERIGRHRDRRFDSRLDRGRDADPHGRRRRQQRGDRRLRHRRRDQRQSRPYRGSARRGRRALRLVGDRRCGQPHHAEGSGPLKLSYDGEGGNRATQRQAVVFDGADGRLAYSGSLSYFSTTAFRPRNASFDNLSGVSAPGLPSHPRHEIHRLRALHSLQR